MPCYVPMTMKELVIIYEREQIDTVLDYVQSRGDAEIISLDFWVERELQKHGVVVHPLTDYVPNWREFPDLFMSMEHTARHWHQLPAMSFFEHKGLRIGEALEPI